MLASDAYVEFNLASNQPGTALVTDPSLSYAWGITTSSGASGGFSVSDTSPGRSNSYSGDAAGSPFVVNAAEAVDVPLATGQVYNGNANEFIVHSSNPPDGTPPIIGGPAEFIYASLNGTIYGFNANLGQHAVPAVSVPGAAFTGLTLANNGTSTNGGGDQLYAADFLGGKIDVFDANFQPITTSGSFSDPNLPDGYKPFNIHALDGELYVSYANWAITPLAPTAGSTIPTPAPGGVVDVFDTAGNFIGRIASGPALDQPWGMALAPQSFGKFAGDLLVANHGSGEIDVFNPTPSTAATANTLLGTLGGADGNPFVVDGLLGLALGNGDNAGDPGSLYCTAGTIPLLLTPLTTASTGPSLASMFSIPSISHGTLGTIQVAAANPLVAVGTNTTTNAGHELTGALASFGSADLPNPTAHPEADYIATIEWGDGSSTASGTVVPTGNGGFLVVGSHTYTAAGTDDYTVKIQDAAGNAVAATGTVEVTPASLVAKAVPIHSDGLVVDNASVAVFVDTGGADPLANYSATIDWGDGSTSTGKIAGQATPFDANVAGGYFTVAGSHTYTATGDYTVTVTISDTDGGQATVTGTAEVAQATLVAHALPIQSDGLTIDNANVATFIDTGGVDLLTNYSATIDWGDGSSSTGTISGGIAVPNEILTGGMYNVAASHTYAASGDYTLTITISDTDGSQATVTGTAEVSQATLLAHALPVKSDGLAVNNSNVAVFSDTGGPDPLANYSATIDWGDGSSSSGTVTSGITPLDASLTGGPVIADIFSVSGSHTYTATGDYTVTITISDTDGGQATVTGTVSVATPTLKATALPVVSQGLSLNDQTVADFVDTGGGDPLSNYSATIDWGDGSTSTGTIHELVADPAPGATLVGPFFEVLGSHTYAATGNYTFSVTISDSDGTSATVTATAHIAHAPLLAVGVPVVVNSGLSVDGALVAAFADADGGDPLASYSATIDWGDGSSSSAGSVTGSGNSFVVAGSHTYAASGDYSLKIAISDQDGSTATAKSHAFIDAPVASFVASAFQDVLHRAPDDSGLNFWNQQLAAGLPQDQFASDLAHSAEFYATNVISPDYQKYLGRASDAAGLSYWTSQMQQGMSDQQLEASFIASTEFYAHTGGTSSGWINAMYQAVLGRQADSQGLAYWLQQLSSGASRSSVAMSFASSSEREAQLIQQDYFTYLGRSAGPSEVNYWVAQFEHGATNEDIVSGFVGSSEFYKLHS